MAPTAPPIRKILLSGCEAASCNEVFVRRDHLVSVGAGSLIDPESEERRPDQLERVDRRQLIDLLTEEKPAPPADKPARPVDKPTDPPRQTGTGKKE